MLIEVATKKSKKFRKTRFAKSKITLTWQQMDKIKKSGLKDWLNENTTDTVVLYWSTLWFLDEADAMAFKLMWC